MFAEKHGVGVRWRPWQEWNCVVFAALLGESINPSLWMPFGSRTIAIEATDHDNRGKEQLDRKSTRLNSSHRCNSYAVFCLKKKTSGPPAHPTRAVCSALS